jgi:hypothetical protein
MREIGQRRNRPSMLIVLAMPHGRYRDPTEAELSWQIFHALAYGARGISYFAYWTPVNVVGADVLRFRRGLIEDGRPTAHYFEAARLNRPVRAVASQLESYRNIAVRDSVGEIALPLPFGPIAALSGAPVTAGIFANETGQLAVLLVNRDYRRSRGIALEIRPGTGLPERFDAERGTWSPGSASVMLPAGGAQLLRWDSSQ